MYHIVHHLHMVLSGFLILLMHPIGWRGGRYVWPFSVDVKGGESEEGY